MRNKDRTSLGSQSITHTGRIMGRYSRLVSLILILSVLSLSFSAPVQSGAIHKRVMTEQEFEQLKNVLGVAVPGVNYNLVVDGYGTGLKPPSDADWEQIRNLPILVDSVEPMLSPLPTRVDNSETPWFPPIGDQGAEGSCVLWSMAYYIKTFQEAKEHGWDLSGCAWEGGMHGYPSLACQDTIFSPDFIYHLINGGVDSGSNVLDAIAAMSGLGAATWAKMPYDETEFMTWPSEAAWRQAPLYRADGYWILNVTTDEGIQNLKVILANENLAMVRVNSQYYSVLSEEDLWTTDTYTSLETNHLTTVVGYDDNFGPYTEGGVEKFGAFKVANSHGLGMWENVPDGFFWISPETMKQYNQFVGGPEDILDYQPKMIAVFEIDHDRRGEVEIEFQLDNAAVKRLNDYTISRTTQLSFPENKMAMDVTELMPVNLRGRFSGMLKVFDGEFLTTGVVEHFSVEIYDNYISGIPKITVNSADAPLATENLKSVYLSLSSFWGR